MFKKNDKIDVFSYFIFDTVIPKDHILRKIDSAVHLAVSEQVRDAYKWSTRGAPGYDPDLLFRISFLKRYYDLSWDRLLDRLNTDIALRWFVGLGVTDPLPSKATLSVFMRYRMGSPTLKSVFNDVVRQAKDHGLIRNEKLLVDGTLIRANCKLLPRGQMVMALALKLAKATGLQGLERPRTDDLNLKIGFAQSVLQRLNQMELSTRLLRKRELLRTVVEQQLSKDSNRIGSPTDVDARIVGRKNTRILGHVAVIAMDHGSEIVTAIDVVPANANEGKHLLGLVEAHMEVTEGKPQEVIADTAYGHGENLRALLNEGIMPVIPPKPHGTQLFHQSLFTLSQDRKSLTCPAGQTTTTLIQNKGDFLFRFSRTQCSQCPLKGQCTAGARREVNFSKYTPEISQVKQALKSRSRSMRDRMTIEHKNAEAKNAHGMSRMESSGSLAAEILGVMAFLVTNVKRITTLLDARGRACLVTP